MEIRRLIRTDLEGFFLNRLRALENEPTLFMTTLEEERVRGSAFFDRLLSIPGDDNVIFGAVLGSTVYGTIGVYRGDRPKTRHKATIWGMYVDGDVRNQGVGGRLLDIAIVHAREKMKVAAIYLEVESSNQVARRLYDSRGFEFWGTEPKAMYYEGNYYDQDHLVLEL